MHHTALDDGLPLTCAAVGWSQTFRRFLFATMKLAVFSILVSTALAFTPPSMTFAVGKKAPAKKAAPVKKAKVAVKKAAPKAKAAVKKAVPKAKAAVKKAAPKPKPAPKKVVKKVVAKKAPPKPKPTPKNVVKKAVRAAPKVSVEWCCGVVLPAIFCGFQ